MNRSDFRRLLRYSDNCWRLLDETLATIPQAAELWDKAFDTPSQWNTVRLLLAHSIGAEERLITARLRNLPLPTPYEERAAPDRASFFRDQQTIRAATYACLDSLTDADLEDEKEVWRIQDIPQSRSDILFQVVNHENYHRGQVVMALRQPGLDPPNFDYVLLKEARGS